MWEENRKIVYDEKKPSNLDLGQGKKNRRFVDIADRKIDEKPPNLIGTEEENRS